MPYNLTEITDLVLKEDGEVLTYPLIYEYEIAGESQDKRVIDIKLWGCNWNCKWCPLVCFGLTEMLPLGISVDELTDLSLTLEGDSGTMLAISGGEPLIQREEVLKLIDSLKKKTSYSLVLACNEQFSSRCKFR
jgi:organic radical activating enzyme